MSSLAGRQIFGMSRRAACQIWAGMAATAENLKKLEICDIIKVETFLRAQKIYNVSNFAIRANLCYNIYVR